MTTATITISSKGQVTIPSKILKIWNLSKGDKLSLKANERQIIIQKDLDILNKLSGILYDPKRKPVKDLDKLINKAKEAYFREKWSKKKL